MKRRTFFKNMTVGSTGLVLMTGIVYGSVNASTNRAAANWGIPEMSFRHSSGALHRLLETEITKF